MKCAIGRTPNSLWRRNKYQLFDREAPSIYGDLWRRRRNLEIGGLMAFPEIDFATAIWVSDRRTLSMTGIVTARCEANPRVAARSLA